MGELQVRQPAVAGSFYPAQADGLRTMVQQFLQQAHGSASRPCAVVAPHAGYVYSGHTAGYAYRPWLDAPREAGGDASAPLRILLIGPSHRVAFEGVSVGPYDAFMTPLGRIDVDVETTRRMVQQEPDVISHPAPHQAEHALEVQLPFLQEVFGPAGGSVRIVPMVVGRMAPQRLAELLEKYRQPGDLLVCSSDLSHYYAYDEARQRDAACHRAVAERDPQGMAVCEACGNTGMSALLHLARHHDWQTTLADYRTSGDTAGDRNRVVGYATYLFHQAHQGNNSGQVAA
jgi:AmmeMemoRadiSam system protein B